MTYYSLNKQFKDPQSFSQYFETFYVLPNFLLTQAKRCMIITYKHGIYELSHELLSNLKPRILGN